jgi:hypothetical protein
MQKLIDSLSDSVPAALIEVITLGRTLKQRSADVLAYLTGPAPATGLPRPSTVGSNTSAVPPSGSATSPTTSPDAYNSKPADPDSEYTVSGESPLWTRVKSHQTCNYLVNTTSRK